MSARSERLLERARRSVAGWKRTDLDRLYLSFGFTISHGSKHDIAKHPLYPDLRATLTRDKSLAKGYIATAIKLIEALQERQGGRGT